MIFTTRGQSHNFCYVTTWQVPCYVIPILAHNSESQIWNLNENEVGWKQSGPQIPQSQPSNGNSSLRFQKVLWLSGQAATSVSRWQASQGPAIISVTLTWPRKPGISDSHNLGTTPSNLWKPILIPYSSLRRRREGRFPPFPAMGSQGDLVASWGESPT